MKRLTALLLALLLLPLTALADIAWPDQTPGQVQLREYISRVNLNLEALGQPAVNALFECYPGFATLGVTSAADVTTPEGVELTFAMYNDCLNTLQLRVNNTVSFAALAGSCIQAASPSALTLEQAMADPTRYMQKAASAPANSFEDAVDVLNGPSARMYYAYYPNQYKDGVNWLQLTLIFPIGGVSDALPSATQTPPPQVSSYYDDNADTGFERYDYDGGTHLEIFTTATPEPDSAAAEE